MSACETPLLDGCSSAHLHEEAVAAAHRPRKLRLIAVIAIIYFNVSGGPLGSEQIISALGPAVGLSAICVFACVYSIPQAAVTAELSAAFPSNGGYSLWVQAAFGNSGACRSRTGRGFPASSTLPSTRCYSTPLSRT